MKPLAIHDANGLQLSPLETVNLFSVLMRLGIDDANPTPQDRAFARDFLIRASLLYPGYADKAGKR